MLNQAVSASPCTQHLDGLGWACSSLSKSFLSWRSPDWILYSKCGLTSLNVLGMLFVRQQSTQPAFAAARARRPLFSLLLTRTHFLQSCFLAPWLPTHTAAWGYSVPHTGQIPHLSLWNSCCVWHRCLPADHSSQPGVIQKLAEGSLHPTTQAVNEHSQQHRPWKLPVMDAGIVLSGVVV